uniref:centrosomal protein of 55 kDa-like n=1 Tax=Doryrhamphus excisus TaxID=161450 RepID=UPI0025AE005F|nr:centrosomal protein of 55 kDa-like [Doryrhamphus excisus]
MWCEEREMSSKKVDEAPGNGIVLKNKYTTKESASNEQASLARNQQWHSYDQDREACMRAVVDMMWVEKELDEMAQGELKPHNKDLSEEDSISDMIDDFEISLEIDQHKLAQLQQQLDTAREDLARANERCQEKESEVSELKQQLECHQLCYKENEQLTEELRELQNKLEEERQQKDKLKMKSSILWRVMVERYQADQEKIKHLEKQINISSQDLEDEVQGASYLRKQMHRLCKIMQRTVDKKTVKKLSDTEGYEAIEETDNMMPCSSSAPKGSIVDESVLSCPRCCLPYPASQYGDLLSHMEVCLD